MEIKITRALTEELIKMDLNDLREDLFEEAIEQIEMDYENHMECGEEKSLNEIAKTWIEDTKINCPAYLTQKINNFSQVVDYYEKKYTDFELKELWTIGNETNIALKIGDPNGLYQVELITLKNGTIYNNEGQDIVEIDINNSL